LYDDTKTPRPLERRDLDAAAPDHPVVVQHRGGHTAFVNSRAFKLANIEENTPNPTHGEYFRDAAGRHNGRVAENAADPILALAIKAPSREEYRQGAALISRQFVSRGITSACEADGDPARRGLAGDFRARAAKPAGAAAQADPGRGRRWASSRPAGLRDQRSSPKLCASVRRAITVRMASANGSSRSRT